MQTLKRELNRFLGTPRQPVKPRKSRSGVGAARLRAHPRVWFVDGRDVGFEDWFVTMRPGWCWGPGYYGEHAMGFQYLREALAAVERAEPCDCDDCKRELGG